MSRRRLHPRQALMLLHHSQLKRENEVNRPSLALRWNLVSLQLRNVRAESLEILTTQA